MIDDYYHKCSRCRYKYENYHLKDVTIKYQKINELTINKEYQYCDMCLSDLKAFMNGEKLLRSVRF